MEISLLRVLLDNISSFFHLSSNDNLDHEPALKYYQKIEDILELVKPVLSALLTADKTYEEPLLKTFSELGLTIKELRELFGSWHPLKSKINFVLQLETLISKVQASCGGVLELLKSSDQDLPLEFRAPSLELYAQKIKQIDVEEISVAISEAIREQEDGSRLSSETLAKFADYLSLRSNQELLIEAVALERLKENAEQVEKNSEAEYIEQIISVVTCMHERLFMIKQSQISNRVPLPADFCCPLSLELMTDPVIVHSGQTYERAYIRKWIDLGLTVCPKTRQALAHTNLIPNYTVKALIANWCESNNVKLPDPVRPVNLNLPSSPARVEYVAPTMGPTSRSHRPVSPGSVRSMGSPANNLVSSGEIHREENSPARSLSASEVPADNSEDRTGNSGEQALELGDQSPTSPSTEHSSDSGELPIASASGTPSNRNITESRETSGELTSAGPTTTTTTPPREFAPRTRNQMIWRRPSDRFGPRIVSSPSLESRPDLSGIVTQVKELVEALKSTSVEEQRKATHEIRLLAKHNTDNRIVIANCGSIVLLVDLLRSTDKQVQGNSVTALLNLSINDNNKTAIASDEAIASLIHVLETGSPEAKANSAATLFSLSVIEDNKVRIGRSGAIKPLVDLLGHGTPLGKKDAATALFNLSIFHENKGRIVQAGAVKYLVDLMDPATGMVDKAVAVLANLSTIQEGRTAIGQEAGIPVLVEVVELGSARGKENAAAALLQLCTNSNRFCSMVLQEGAVPPLVALSQTGTPRAKEKAQALLSYFRNQRHGNGGRN